MINEVHSINESIDSTFNKMTAEKSRNANDLMSTWEKVLSKIVSRVNPNEGKNLCEHSRVVDYRNGLLIVEADHPGWISLLQMHKNFILKGLQMNVPDLKITNLGFKLKGKKDDVYGVNVEEMQHKTREELEKQIEDAEKFLKDAGYEAETKPKPERSRELPPELAAMFEEMKESVLTNSKK